VPGLASQQELTEEQVRDKFYKYWERSKARNVWVPSDGILTMQDQQAESPRGSQAVLLSSKEEKPKWSRGSDFLGSTWAFSLSLHSLWVLPLSVVQYGGIAYLLLYTAVLAVLGGPLLLLELSLGQYSGLAPAQLYAALCPVLGGLGPALVMQAAIRAVLDMAVLMWASQAIWHLASQQSITQGFFYRDVLHTEESSLAQLGQLVGQLVLVLAIVCVAMFILMAAGTRSVGKVCLICVPACFMILVTLTIRSCLASGGPHGVLLLLSPDWSVLTQPTVWLQVTGQVIFSLQLGLGPVAAYASYNTYQHNIVRDCAVIILSHLVWVILAILLTFSLLGIAHTSHTINLTDPSLISITGQGLWLAAVTLIESSLSNISYGWFWAELFFMLLVMVSATSLFGYLEIITSSLISYRPSILPFKPALTFTVLSFLFLVDLVLAMEGGIHAYHLLLTYLYSWPALLASLLTVVAAVLCHGTRTLMADIACMSKLALPFWVSSHLSVIYLSVLPTFLCGSLVFTLHSLSSYHISEPLASFPLPACLGLGLSSSATRAYPHWC
jgi:SNF family Na+-dependent transporter